MSTTLNLAMELISRPSITPEDAGCQELISAHLDHCGFKLSPLPFGKVTNLWAQRGSAAPLIVFAGHSDVVPPGPIENWLTPPFVPTLNEGWLYGRGAADMKGGLAAMITAVESFLTDYPNHCGSIGVLITSDEEGVAVDGTRRVIEYLQSQGVVINFCILGEPSSESRIADCVKNGRRGSLNGELTIYGKQGHVAYPHLVINPIEIFAPALLELVTTTWDNGNDYFPPTSFQFSNINSGTGAVNIVPGELNALFNFRFSTAITIDDIKKRFTAILDQYQLNYQLNWSLSGNPFLTSNGILLDIVQQAITEITGYNTYFSTAGGTSDGRFIAPTGAQVIELGLLNTTIHQINERIAIADLDILHQIYKSILIKLLV